jgi:3-oxoacyl-[acyl-carrier-protein] synthase-1
MRVAYDVCLGHETRVFDRMKALATSAIQEACAALGARKPKLSVFVGLPEERPGWTPAHGAALMAEVGRACGEFGKVEQLLSFPRGHAAGFLALEQAVAEIEGRSTELALVGGVDSYLDAPALEWLDANRQLASDANRSAFTPGEGAAFALLASKGIGRVIGIDEHAHVLGVATGHEPNRMKTDTICVGEGLSHVIAAATRGLRLPEQKITTTFCDINGERYRSEEFMYVPLRVWAPFVDANVYDAPADCWGDVGAASGPLFTTLAAVSARRGHAKGKYVLTWASSEGGARGACALELAEGPKEVRA